MTLLKNPNLVKAKNKLLISEPFFGSLLLRMNFIEDDSQPTFWTNGKDIGFNTELAESMPNSQCRALLAHEIMHCVFKHIVRCLERHPKKWNYACDYAINPGLKDAGFDIPDWMLLEDQFRNKSAEQIYALLPDDFDKDEGANAGKGRAGPTDDVRPHPTVSQKELEIEWTIATQQALNEARTRGKLPANLEQTIVNILEAAISWKRQLQEFMTKPRRDDYSRRRPNKRFITSGLYLPRMYSEGLGLVVLALDTSSSTLSYRDQFAAEFNAILEETHPEKIIVLSVDTYVAKIQEFTPDDIPITLSVKGGGGTEFDPPFIYVEDKLDEVPDVFIYLTDLEGDCQVNAPEYPVMWVSTTTLRDVPFGEVINI